MAIDWESLRNKLESANVEHQRNALIPAGEYTGRMLEQEVVKDAWGRVGSRVTLEVADGEHAGTRLIAHVYGTADALLKSRAARDALLQFHVYVRRLDDGRAYSRLNVETLRLALSTDGVPESTATEMPTATGIQQNVADFTFGFTCLDRIDGKRTVVEWYEHFTTMAEYETTDVYGRCVFGSTYCFTNALGEHIAENDRKAAAAGIEQRGSMAGFNGPAYSPLLTFDIDRYDSSGNPDPLTAQKDACRLVATLLELGVPRDLILVFFSGSKGFHVQIPSSLAGALPSDRFAATACEFCSAIAGQTGVPIDVAMYRTLQPLRSPNSKNEKTGLFKVRLFGLELQTLSISEIETLAIAPRRFGGPDFVQEPISSLAAIWKRAEHLDAIDVTRLFRSTWDFLVNGAPEGSRATELFKAAANLMDFESVEHLARALLQRPVEMSGLTPREADTHIDGAVQRAVDGR
jgi:hypothetical protein